MTPVHPLQLRPLQLRPGPRASFYVGKCQNCTLKYHANNFFVNISVVMRDLRRTFLKLFCFIINATCNLSLLLEERLDKIID